MDKTPRIELAVAPFQVPTATAAVLPEASGRRLGQQGPAILLRDLSEDVLSALCDKFRADVFKNAGIDDSRAQRKSLDPTLNLGAFLADLRLRMESHEGVMLASTDIGSVIEYMTALYT